MRLSFFLKKPKTKYTSMIISNILLRGYVICWYEDDVYNFLKDEILDKLVMYYDFSYILALIFVSDGYFMFKALSGKI